MCWGWPGLPDVRALPLAPPFAGGCGGPGDGVLQVSIGPDLRVRPESSGGVRRPNDDAWVAAIIVYVPQDERGNGILDALEEATQVAGAPADYAPDARQYWVPGDSADVHAIEPMLDKVAPDWADHITLVSPG